MLNESTFIALCYLLEVDTSHFNTTSHSHYISVILFYNILKCVKIQNLYLINYSVNLFIMQNYRNIYISPESYQSAEPNPQDEFNTNLPVATFKTQSGEPSIF